MVVVTPQAEIDAYFASPAIDQSGLKALTHGVAAYKAYKNKDFTSSGFTVGSAVDMILTGEKEEFEKQYYINTSEEVLTEVEVEIISLCYSRVKERGLLTPDSVLTDFQTDLLMSIHDCNWQSRWKDATKVEKMVIKGTSYFNVLKESANKKIINSAEYDRIESVVQALCTSPRTKEFFDRETLAHKELETVYYQKPIYFQLPNPVLPGKMIDCKALLDLLIVRKDITGKIVKLLPYDLKTTGFALLDFKYTVKKFRYDIQSAFYTDALKAEYGLDYDVDEDREIIQDFTFIVESTITPGSPCLFQVTPSLLNIGANGLPGISFRGVQRMSEVVGYKKLLEDYAFYEYEGYDVDIRDKEIIYLNW